MSILNQIEKSHIERYTIQPQPDWIIRAATLTVCAEAVDATEARDLLEMLGLTDRLTS